jgi:nitrite reductase/ring-hydroxylating ferredoxin subunit
VTAGVADPVKVGDLRQFRSGRARTVDFHGAKVAVFRTRDGWVAVSDACPHMGASLAMGRLVDGAVECAWHHWKFDARTGRNAFKSWACVKVYVVRVIGNDVFLEEPGPEEVA